MLVSIAVANRHPIVRPSIARRPTPSYSKRERAIRYAIEVLALHICGIIHRFKSPELGFARYGWYSAYFAEGAAESDKVQPPSSLGSIADLMHVAILNELTQTRWQMHASRASGTDVARVRSGRCCVKPTR